MDGGHVISSSITPETIKKKDRILTREEILKQFAYDKKREIKKLWHRKKAERKRKGDLKRKDDLKKKQYQRRKKDRVFGLYKGDEFIDTGTLVELSEKHDIPLKTLKYYACPSYQKIIKTRKEYKRLILIEIESEE